ncbi:MAG: RNA polymerase sigma factor [Pseudomonadota bacterium]
MATDDTDEALMLRYAAGDAAAFETLYARHKGPLFRYFQRQCEPSQAEELFQDVWMRLIKSRESYQVEAKFTTYLYRIAHNRLVDHYRMRARRDETSLDAASEDDGYEPAAPATEEPSAISGRREQVARFAEALDNLPEEQREAFVLREEGGLSLDEIAAATNVGRETAKSRLRYAVSRLRKALEEYR